MNNENPVVVIKVGGSMLLSAAAMDDFWLAIKPLLPTRRALVVHGAGPQTTALSQQLGTPVTKVAGRRVTSDEALRNLLWAGRGELNTHLVGCGFAHGIGAVGLSGVDAGILQVKRRPPREIDGQQVDFGWVGDVIACQTRALAALLDQGLVPVVASLGVGHDGQIYNVNADTVAAQLAISMAAEEQGSAELFLITESGGVMQDGTLQSTLSRSAFASAVEDGWIEGGMRVKLESGFRALDQGVRSVRIAALSDLDQATGGTELA